MHHYRDRAKTNIIFDSGDEVIGVVDFDMLKRQPRAVELMRALKLCFLHKGEILSAADDFLAGYLAVVAVGAEEVAAYAPLYAFLSMVNSPWPISNRYLKPEIYDPRWDRFIGPRDDWWERHTDELTDRLLRIHARARR